VYIDYEVSDCIATITLNRPVAANAQNPELLDELDGQRAGWGHLPLAGERVCAPTRRDSPGCRARSRRTSATCLIASCAGRDRRTRAQAMLGSGEASMTALCARTAMRERAQMFMNCGVSASRHARSRGKGAQSSREGLEGG
jgi:hypothetical protein